MSTKELTATMIEILASHVAWLRRDLPGGARADLRNANLRDADLPGADLNGADFDGANRLINPPKGWESDASGRLRRDLQRRAI